MKLNPICEATKLILADKKTKLRYSYITWEETSLQAGRKKTV